MSSRIARRMSINTLIRRVEKLDQKFNPPPLIIDAGKAKEELLMMLEMQMAKDEEEGEEKEESPIEWTPEQIQFAEEFGTYLEESMKHICKTNNIKLINC
jgi:hypothetical protein